MLFKSLYSFLLFSKDKLNKPQEMDCLYHMVKQFSSVSIVSRFVIIGGYKESSKQ